MSIRASAHWSTSTRLIFPDQALRAARCGDLEGRVRAAALEDVGSAATLALVCFDDIEHVSRIHPFLNRHGSAAETFGTIATQLLLHRLGSRVAPRRRMVVLPADFIARQSSGAAVEVV